MTSVPIKINFDGGPIKYKDVAMLGLFEYAGKLYMKIRDDKVQAVVFNDTSYSPGTLVNFGPDAMVTPLEGELIVKTS